MFKCKLINDLDESRIEELDFQQVGHQWIELADIEQWNVFPKILKKSFNSNGEVISGIYLGDVN